MAGFAILETIAIGIDPGFVAKFDIFYLPVRVQRNDVFVNQSRSNISYARLYCAIKSLTEWCFSFTIDALLFVCLFFRLSYIGLLPSCCTSWLRELFTCFHIAAAWFYVHNNNNERNSGILYNLVTKLLRYVIVTAAQWRLASRCCHLHASVIAVQTMLCKSDNLQVFHRTTVAARWHELCT